jgi:WXG100 family type VII secretion target
VSGQPTITKYIPGYPYGSPGDLRFAASIWQAAASQLRTQIDDTERQIASLGRSWQGAAKTAFEDEWTRFAGAVKDGCGELSKMARALNNAADQLEDAQHTYEVQAAGIGLTIAVGVVFTPFTFGASDAAAAEAASVEIGAAVATAAEAGSIFEAALLLTLEMALELVGRFVINFAAIMAGQIGDNIISTDGRQPFQNLDWDGAAGWAAIDSVLPAPPGGAVGSVIENVALNAGETAATEEWNTGTIDPGLVIFNGGLGAASSVASPGDGVDDGDGDDKGDGDGSGSGKRGGGGKHAAASAGKQAKGRG